jgi:hypothetical protein
MSIDLMLAECSPSAQTRAEIARGYFMTKLNLLATAGLVLFSAMPASAQSGAKAGLLSCNMSPTIGPDRRLPSTHPCRFTPDAGGAPEAYTGSITRIGLDHRGALRGNYVGASADASLGLGAGAKVLVGGSHRTISLQPLAVQGQAGVNLALGVAGLRLR